MLSKCVELTNKPFVCHRQLSSICHGATARMAEFGFQLCLAVLKLLICTPNIQPLINDGTCDTETKTRGIFETRGWSAIAAIPHLVQRSVLLLWLDRALNIRWKAELKNHWLHATGGIGQSHCGPHQLLFWLAEQLFDAANCPGFHIICHCMQLQYPSIKEAVPVEATILCHLLQGCRNLHLSRCHWMATNHSLQPKDQSTKIFVVRRHREEELWTKLHRQRQRPIELECSRHVVTSITARSRIFTVEFMLCLSDRLKNPLQVLHSVQSIRKVPG
mmetsp:Transcript_14662/g.30573  ORF Transcript_14662/g.30573 Transcript_14662/m.30573 type:complete len:275 (-) Transcript_14662:17-841(-)